VSALNPATVAHVIGANQLADEAPLVRELPEPLAVVEYLAADLDDDGREFVPTAVSRRWPWRPFIPADLVRRARGVGARPG
jgi:hypothetical protein